MHGFGRLHYLLFSVLSMHALPTLVCCFLLEACRAGRLMVWGMSTGWWWLKTFMLVGSALVKDPKYGWFSCSRDLVVKLMICEQLFVISNKLCERQ